MEPFNDFPIGQETPQLPQQPPPPPQHAETSNAARARPNHHRIIHQKPPRILTVDIEDFPDIVQRLTGLSPGGSPASTTTTTTNAEPLNHGTRMAPTMHNMPRGIPSPLDSLRQTHQPQGAPPPHPPLQEVLYPPWAQQADLLEPPRRRPSLQAEFSQEFPYVLPRAPVAQTFPTPMDMENFEYLRDLASPSTRRVLRPNTPPSVWFSVPAPAFVPPLPPDTQYDPNLFIPTFSSGTESSSNPGSSTGPGFFSNPASASGSAFSLSSERADVRGRKRSREHIE